MTVWLFTSRYHPRGMDDPHSGTKDIRSGGGVTAGREDLTDDGDILQCVRQLIQCRLLQSSIKCSAECPAIYTQEVILVHVGSVCFCVRQICYILTILEFVDNVYKMWSGLNTCGLDGNAQYAQLCPVFFFLFCVPLGSAFLCTVLCSVLASIVGVKGDVFPWDKQRNYVTHSCQHVPVHFERQLYIGICCPKACMYLIFFHYIPQFQQQ